MRRLPAIARAVVALLAVVSLSVASSCDESDAEALARKVVYDLSLHSFSITRRFASDYDGRHVEWTERVRSAGDGTTLSVELLTRNGHARTEIVDPAELAAFDLLAAQFATGGGARVVFQRDPAPDDYDRMLANYYVTIVELGREPITKRGEPSLTYMIEPVVPDRPFYVLTVSTRNGREGFPIACQEWVKDASGSHLVSAMDVLEIESWGKQDGVRAPESPIVDRVALDSLDDASTRAKGEGLRLVLPRDGSLPAGFVLCVIERIAMRTTANAAGVEQTLPLYRFVYSDGVEHIDFVEHAPIDTLPPGYLDNDSEDVAFVTRFGSISSATLLHAGTQVVVESRIAADRFEPMLRDLAQL